MTYDLILRNARVIDPSQAIRQVLDSRPRLRQL